MQRLIEAAHRAGQRIVYHLCGKIMPMLERTLEMKVDAIGDVYAFGHGRRCGSCPGARGNWRAGMHDRRL